MGYSDRGDVTLVRLRITLMMSCLRICYNMELCSFENMGVVSKVIEFLCGEMENVVILEPVMRDTTSVFFKSTVLNQTCVYRIYRVHIHCAWGSFLLISSLNSVFPTWNRLSHHKSWSPLVTRLLDLEDISPLV